MMGPVGEPLWKNDVIYLNMGNLKKYQIKFNRQTK